MAKYLKNNLFSSLKASPFKVPLRVWLTALPFMAGILVIGLASGVLSFGILKSNLVFVLPFTLLVVPCLLEESFFRGILIPRNILEHGWKRALLYISVSTILFVLWHPVNALLYNHSAIPLFLNPWFMLMVTLLGFACGLGYVLSRSLWVPVLIHWITVLVWVIFLNGRNIAMGIQ